ncbi:MAG: MarR family transcriptional regulator [Chloroflexota bacterium]|nr:MarR family transcriptional regulator [Chloroflexota bacterium]
MTKPTMARDELLRLLARMPFLDRLELAALSGRSRGAVYAVAGQLEDAGLVRSLRHGTELVAPTRRYRLTAAGVRRLADAERVSVERLLQEHPLAARCQRALLERLDAVAALYRLAVAVSDLHHPIGFRWYRAMPADAALVLPDGRVVAVVRLGGALDRTAVAKRLSRLARGRQPGGFLVIVPDETRLRQARRLLRGGHAPAVLATERSAAWASPSDPAWRLPGTGAAVSLAEAILRMNPGGALPIEEPPARLSLPEDFDTEDRSSKGTPDLRLLPARLRPAEKRALDLLADWPWLSLGHLAGMLGVTAQRASQLVTALEDHGLARVVRQDRRRLVLTDAGLTLLARRDRAAVGLARRRWSTAPAGDGSDGGNDDWRGVSGRRSRQLLRDLEHTAAVHGFMAALARQARQTGWRVEQLDPPHRASRYFRHYGRLRSLQPDAFLMLRKGRRAHPCFLEWERRAVRPATMAARIAPYLRYYSSHRPLDDHGASPFLLAVFDDPIAQTHFLEVAGREMDRLRTTVPLLASSRELVQREGPLGRAWLIPGHWEPVAPLNRDD